MGYRIIEPLINTSNIVPLGVPINSFGPIYLTIDQAFQNLKTLLLTRKGERYGLPTFGTDLLKIIFEPNASALKDQIRDIITQPVSYWLPYIDLDDINIVTNEDDPNLNYNIQITISFSVGAYDTSTITLTADEGILEVS
jgi:phage baseplate assembly protein W